MSEHNFSGTRRQFVGTGIAGIIGAGVALKPAFAAAMHNSVDDTLKIGLVGCGGRGMGAVNDSLTADPYTKVTALADVFPEEAKRGAERLRKNENLKDRIDLPEERVFSGFDAYEKLLTTDVNVVLLATPPFFRPIQLQAAINAGKHVFCEKPVASDPVGCRKVDDAAKLAKEKGLTLISGLCWRYEKGMQDIIAKIHDGALGEIKSLNSIRFNYGVDKRSPRTEGMGDMEFQLRNWYYYTWLSADFFAEQFVHELDKMSWVMQNEYPSYCICSGGRQTRTGEQNGNVYDHFSAVYHYASGIRYHATSRQQLSCSNSFQDYVIGTKGTADLMDYKIEGENPYHIRKNVNQMYLNEHIALYDSIRNGKALNNGDYMVKSSMMGIMARMSAYTGKELTWEQAWNSKLDFSPSEYSFEGKPVPAEVPMPGVTPFV
jgi:predicted dehydrogenase